MIRPNRPLGTPITYKISKGADVCFLRGAVVMIGSLLMLASVVLLIVFASGKCSL